MSITEKLKELRRFYPRLDQEDRDYLDNLRQTASKMDRYPSFLEHPVTIEITKTLVENLKSVTNSMILTLDEGGKIDPRLVGQRMAWLEFLDILCPNLPDRTMLETELDDRLKALKDYYA